MRSVFPSKFKLKAMSSRQNIPLKTWFLIAEVLVHRVRDFVRPVVCCR